MTRVDVDLGRNAYTNAQAYCSTKKKVAQKADRAIHWHPVKALKGAERKAKEELRQARGTKASMQLIRKAPWFAKFVWQVSLENFLVVAGRDAQRRTSS